MFRRSLGKKNLSFKKGIFKKYAELDGEKDGDGEPLMPKSTGKNSRSDAVTTAPKAPADTKAPATTAPPSESSVASSSTTPITPLSMKAVDSVPGNKKKGEQLAYHTDEEVSYASSSSSAVEYASSDDEEEEKPSKNKGLSPVRRKSKSPKRKGSSKSPNNSAPKSPKSPKSSNRVGSSKSPKSSKKKGSSGHRRRLSTPNMASSFWDQQDDFWTTATSDERKKKDKMERRASTTGLDPADLAKLAALTEKTSQQQQRPKREKRSGRPTRSKSVADLRTSLKSETKSNDSFWDSQDDFWTSATSDERKKRDKMERRASTAGLDAAGLAKLAALTEKTTSQEKTSKEKTSEARPKRERRSGRPTRSKSIPLKSEIKSNDSFWDQQDDFWTTATSDERKKRDKMERRASTAGLDAAGLAKLAALTEKTSQEARPKRERRSGRPTRSKSIADLRSSRKSETKPTTTESSQHTKAKKEDAKKEDSFWDQQDNFWTTATSDERKKKDKMERRASVGSSRAFWETEAKFLITHDTNIGSQPSSPQPSPSSNKKKASASSKSTRPPSLSPTVPKRNYQIPTKSDHSIDSTLSLDLEGLDLDVPKNPSSTTKPKSKSLTDFSSSAPKKRSNSLRVTKKDKQQGLDMSLSDLGLDVVRSPRTGMRRSASLANFKSRTDNPRKKNSSSDDDELVVPKPSRSNSTRAPKSRSLTNFGSSSTPKKRSNSLRVTKKDKQKHNRAKSLTTIEDLLPKQSSSKSSSKSSKKEKEKKRKRRVGRKRKKNKSSASNQEEASPKPNTDKTFRISVEKLEALMATKPIFGVDSEKLVNGEYASDSQYKDRTMGLSIACIANQQYLEREYDWEMPLGNEPPSKEEVEAKSLKSCLEKDTTSKSVHWELGLRIFQVKNITTYNESMVSDCFYDSSDIENFRFESVFETYQHEFETVDSDEEWEYEEISDDEEGE